MRIRLSWLIVFSLATTAPAALNRAHTIEQYGHTTWTLRDGALPSHPRAIVQSVDGYVWLATESGILRFDGVKFTPLSDTAVSQLPDGVAVSLLAAADGSLWVGTTRGLARIKDGLVRSYPDLDGQYAGTLLQANDGTIWVGTNGGSNHATVCAIREDSVRCDGRDGALGRFVLSLHEDPKGQLWVGAATGLWLWTPNVRRLHPTSGPLPEIHSIVDDDADHFLVAMNREIVRLTPTGFEPFPIATNRELKPIVMLRDRDRGLWIGTQNQGLLHVHDGRVERFGREHGLSGDFVVSLFEDREGNVWVGTLNGLDRFRSITAARISMTGGLSSDTVMSVQGRADGSIWMSTVDGLDRSQADRITAHPIPGMAPGDAGGALFEDSRERLWFSSLQGVGYLARGKNTVEWLRQLPTRYVHAIVEDHQNHIWISDQHRGLFRLRPDGGVDNFALAQFDGRDVRTLAADPRGGLWLGFTAGGLSYFADGKVQRRIGVADGLADGRVNDLHVDDRGTIWIGTQGGLTRVVGDTVATFRRQEGLPCDAVQWVTTDQFRALWVHTACGLARIPRESFDPDRRQNGTALSLTVYDTADGVPRYSDLGGYGPKVTQARDGKLWFTGYDGVRVINPADLPFNTIPPPVRVERVTADRVVYDTTPRLTLPPLIRDLSIEYTALSLVAPEKVRFRYRLEGRDADWVDAIDRREAFYTDLRPGPYRFHVMAANNHGVWSPGAAVWEFSIAPTFYQTTAFRLTVILLLAVMAYLLHRLRMRRLASALSVRFEERLAERTRIAQDLHDTLLQGLVSTSMHLHFLTADVDDQQLRPKLDAVIKRMSAVMEEGRQALTGLRANAPEDLEQALARDAEQFRGERLIEVHARVHGERRQLRPLVRDAGYQVMREALANAFKHANPRRVEIDLEYTPDALAVTVRDDGCGMDAAMISSGRAGHWGLQDMRERAEAVGGTLRVWSRSNLGTEVNLRMPAKTAFADRIGKWRWLTRPSITALIRRIRD